MSKQNIYDNEIFFEGYKSIRQKKENANILFEKPALFSLLPDLKGKRILDLGCGYGENCIEFVKMGASRVVGVDISKKMLEVAKKENPSPKITYLNIPMEEIGSIQAKFDLIVSSLALHYVENFQEICKLVYNLLDKKGHFIFSQENPINTCFTSGSRWTCDKDGNKLYANISNYSVDGKRCSTWFVDDVIKYHRTFSSIINTLITTGFTLEKLLEPYPSEQMAKAHPSTQDLLHKPDFLVVRATKTPSSIQRTEEGQKERRMQ